MKITLNKQEKESLDNKILFISVAIFLYALLLAFVQRMSASTITVNGALAFIEILRWASLVGAMCCAAWSAYKEKKSFFLYCAVCLSVFISTTVIKFCTQRNSNVPYYINYAALAVLFVMSQIYYALKVYGLIKKKRIRTLFFAACAVIVIGFIAVCVLNINKVFLP